MIQAWVDYFLGWFLTWYMQAKRRALARRFLRGYNWAVKEIKAGKDPEALLAQIDFFQPTDEFDKGALTVLQRYI